MRARPLISISTWLCLALPAAAAPPAAPVIREPTLGQTVSPADVHMVTGDFADPDGDAHRSSDWEIREAASGQRVWSATAARGTERVHIHLGDGVFEGALAGRRELLAGADYLLLVRFEDEAGELSPWAERSFRTGLASQVFPLKLQDIASAPAPRWLDALEREVVLPAGLPAAALRVESESGELLLEVRGLDGATNRLSNPGPLPEHLAVRLSLEAGAAGSSFTLSESSLSFSEPAGAEHTVYLPALEVRPGERACFWVSGNGSTYRGAEGQPGPDFSRIARGAPVPWTVLQPGYRVEVAATGFQLPVNIAFPPRPGERPGDPFFYVSELYGAVKVVTRGGEVRDYVSGLLNFAPSGKFPGSGEQGVAGILVEPATGDLLVSLLYDSEAQPGTRHARVLRFHSEDGGLSASSRWTVLDMPGEPQSASHQVSSLSLGPDAKLYLHVGDGQDPLTAQDLDSFRGKILRFDLDGSPAEGNPFLDPLDGLSARDFVYAYGLRNPFGGGWRASDGVLYEVENGPRTDRLARVERGRNYLWDGADESMRLGALYTWLPAAAPVNIVFIQRETFAGSGFPPEKMGRAYVSESGPTWASGPQFGGKRIRELTIDARGEAVLAAAPLVEYSGPGKATAVALAAGPDGLYFSDFYKDLDAASPVDRGSSILRIAYRGGEPLTPGLKGEYFDGPDFTDLRLTRTDPAVDFDWGAGSPDPLLEADTFSVRWTGQVEPEFSETYRFLTRSDDGVRLWVDGRKLIDNWTDHAAAEDSGVVDLVAGRRYDLTLEWYENRGDALAVLLWESPRRPRQVVPRTRLSSPLLKTPFAGAPRPIPGVIQAEDFDQGGEGVAYHDQDAENRGTEYRSSGVDLEACLDEGGGYNVGWTAAGEWLEYTVEVALAGRYQVEARVAAEGLGGRFHLELGGVDVTGPVTVPDTGGWQKWTSVRVSGVNLRAGVQVLRLLEDAGGPNAAAAVGNLNSLSFVKDNDPPRARPGDCTQDGVLDVSDPVCLLGHLFLGEPRVLPCGDGRAGDPQNVLLLDSNQDGLVELSDAVHLLAYLFLGGAPPALGPGCVNLPACPEACP